MYLWILFTLGFMLHFKSILLYNCIHINFAICFWNYFLLCEFKNLFLWIIYFMFIILILVLFNVTKKIQILHQFYYSVFIYLFIFCALNFMHLLSDLLFFCLFFESILYFILNLQLLYTFSNRYIFAIHFLLNFSFLSGIFVFLMLMLLQPYVTYGDCDVLLQVISADNIYVILFIYFLVLCIFGIKYPLYPFFFWLLSVHVEVSTELSIILAALILKMGFIGFYKFMFMSFCTYVYIFISYIHLISLLGLTIAASILLIVYDIKKTVALWSVLHVNITFLGLTTLNIVFFTIYIYTNLGHIFSSSTFFYFFSILYENTNTKHSAFLQVLNKNTTFLLIFFFCILCNIDFPFTFLFFIELLTYLLFSYFNYFLLILFFFCSFTLFLNSFLLYITTTFYNTKWYNKFFRVDLQVLELINTLLLLLFLTLLFWNAGILHIVY